MDRSQLSSAAQINYHILHRQISDDLAEFEHHTHLLPITQRSGFHIEFPELPQDVPLRTTEDYENYVARLHAFADFTDGHIALLRAGIAAQQVLPAVVMEGWEKPIDAQIVERPAQSLFYGPCKKFPSTVSPGEYQRLRSEVSQAITKSVVPAYQRFRQFMADEYVPQTRDSIGASALPGGRDFYRHRVRSFTTLDTTPEAMHQIGLAEVKRLRAEMDQIIRRVDFDGDFAAFTKFLREDPQFYAKTEEELLQAVALVLKKMDGQLSLALRQPAAHALRLAPGTRLHCAAHDVGLLPNAPAVTARVQASST